MFEAVVTSIGAFRDLMGEHILFTVGAMLLVGYATGVVAGRVGLPQITGFILAGVLLGENVLGIVPLRMTASMKVITEVALGLIALTIGSEFSFFKLKRMGWHVVGITLAQLGWTFALVWAGMALAGMDGPFALITASIATASSPAVAVAVVQALRARGLFVDYLYGVIALLDAGAVILFGISFSLAAGWMGLGGVEASAFSLFLHALLEVCFSILAGGVMGLLLHRVLLPRKSNHEILLIVLGVVFVFIAGSIVLHLSPLLMAMMAGAVLINLSPRHHRVFRTLDPVTPPIYALFFVLAGSELQLTLLLQPHLLFLGGVYVLVRAVAKWSGTYMGACMVRAPASIRDHLGACMLPQAGVALGLVLFVQASPLSAAMSEEQAATATTLVNVILLSVFFYQLVGPPLAKRAVLRGNTMGL